MHQLSFAEQDYSQLISRKRTFLNEMDKTVPWQIIMQAIEPFYPKIPEGKGRRPYPLESMLRIYLMQQWYNLSDPLMESELNDSVAMRNFSKLGNFSSPTPDETTILHFRHLLEKYELASIIFNKINEHLHDSGISVSHGSVVDASIIQAPSSVRNKKKARDPEMHSTVKAKQYYFGAKLHIGIDAESHLIHSAKVTAANVHDINMIDQLIREDDKIVFADSGYQGIEKRTKHKDTVFLTSMRHTKRKENKSAVVEKLEHLKTNVRCYVEYPFRIIKEQFRYKKVKYKGIYKNTQDLIIKCALVNLFIKRKILLDRANSMI